MELRDYQIEGAAWLTQHTSDLLADDPGVGKCAELITAAAATDRRRIVIVGPAVSCQHWINQIHLWAPPWATSRLKGNKQTKTLFETLNQLSLFPSPLVIVLNYEILHTYEWTLSDWADCFIVDESHYCMNPGEYRKVDGLVALKGTRRTAVVDRMAQTIRMRGGVVWLASGTLMPSKPRQLIPQLQIIDKLDSVFGGWEKFVTRYCDGKKEWIVTRGGIRRRVWNIEGSSNLDELRSILSDTCMLRRRRSEVMPGIKVMPPIVQYVDTSDDRMKEYASAEHDIGKHMWDKVYTQLVAEGHPNPSQEAMDAMVRAEAGGHLVELGALRQTIGLAKLDACEKWISDWLDANPSRQLVVFAHHREFIESLRVGIFNSTKGEISPTLIIGGMGDDKRNEAIKRFISGKSQIAICSTPAAGISIDFSNASDVVFCEFEWTSAMHKQATERCARGEQKEPISVTYLAAKDSIDGDMAEHIAKQMEIVDQVFGDGEDVAQAAILRLIKKGK